ncbi:MAG: LemA family protein [Candidatus Omnitrophica bacterium]|jgi:LemA protein|nr:LemA family protein [Candidatus Omnitrophota bacterium]
MIMIAGIILATGVFSIVIFNRLVRFKTLMAEAQSGIDVQLKRRYDLIPNIVEAVKGYMQYERDVLERITGLRSLAMNASGSLKDKAETESRLSSAVKQLFVLAENYPDLKASENFLGLQSALMAVEDELQMARRYYNGTVRNYNILVQSFPGNIAALAFGFRSAEFFEIEYATERLNPDVKFS